MAKRPTKRQLREESLQFYLRIARDTKAATIDRIEAYGRIADLLGLNYADKNPAIKYVGKSRPVTDEEMQEIMKSAGVS
jgi:hypothetical protein